MEFIDRVPIPKRLSATVWLVSLPSALVSFERRQKVPPLPLGVLRFLGLPLVIAGVALTIWSWRRPNASIPYDGPLSELTRKPATAGGILALGGIAFLMRSAALALYSAGIAFAAHLRRSLSHTPRIAMDAQHARSPTDVTLDEGQDPLDVPGLHRFHRKRGSVRGPMALRWAAASFVETKKNYRRIIGTTGSGSSKPT